MQNIIHGSSSRTRMPITASPTSLPGVMILEPRVFGDSRGFFLESFNQREFRAATGVTADFVQDNHSLSQRGVLRGMHYQIRHAQGKLVRVVRGSVFDVAVDMRRSSPAFGKWLGLELSADNKRQLWIPPGFAHGFLVTSDSAEFLYKTTDYYHPEHERSLLWNDPDVGIDWPIDGTPLLFGNARLMREEGIDMSALSADAERLAGQGRTVSWLADAQHKRVLGLVAFGDEPKPQAAEAIARLKTMGIRTVMLSGDSRGAAQAVAARLGIERVEAEILPQDKAALITADFVTDRLSGREVYEAVFQHLLKIKEVEQDENHEIYLSGVPVLVGWVLRYAFQIGLYVALTVIATSLPIPPTSASSSSSRKD